MSSDLGAMCLRFAACVALRNQTPCGENIFDSEMKALELSATAPVGGAIAVYTETDDGNALSAQNGGPPFVPHVELCLQITMQVREVGEDGVINIGTPTTDDELEFSIGMVAALAELALFRSAALYSLLFQKVAKRVVSKTSVRFTDPASSQKLAMRYVTYRVEIDDNDPPVFDGTKTGFDKLPLPFSKIAPQWPPDSPEYLKAQAAAAALPGASPTLLQGISTAWAGPTSTAAPNTFNPARKTNWQISHALFAVTLADATLTASASSSSP